MARSEGGCTVQPPPLPGCSSTDMRSIGQMPFSSFGDGGPVLLLHVAPSVRSATYPCGGTSAEASNSSCVVPPGAFELSTASLRCRQGLYGTTPLFQFSADDPRAHPAARGMPGLDCARKAFALGKSRLSPVPWKGVVRYNPLGATRHSAEQRSLPHPHAFLVQNSWQRQTTRKLNFLAGGCTVQPPLGTCPTSQNLGHATLSESPLASKEAEVISADVRVSHHADRQAIASLAQRVGPSHLPRRISSRARKPSGSSRTRDTLAALRQSGWAAGQMLRCQLRRAISMKTRIEVAPSFDFLGPRLARRNANG